MIQTSEQIDQIAAALAKAQAKMENIGKDATNPHFRSKYATLAGVLDEVRPKLAAHGISIWQSPVIIGDTNVGVVTRLLHESGQWLESTIHVATAKFDAQGVGSVITYLRRYSLMAVAGVGPEDDDGNAAVAQPAPRRPGTAERGRMWVGGDRPLASAEPAPRVRDAANSPTSSDIGNGAINEEADAKASGRRVFAALSRAGTVKLIDEIIDINSVDLVKLKGVDEAAYDAVMMKATARKNELLSGA